MCYSHYLVLQAKITIGSLKCMMFVQPSPHYKKIIVIVVV